MSIAYKNHHQCLLPESINMQRARILPSDLNLSKTILLSEYWHPADYHPADYHPADYLMADDHQIIKLFFLSCSFDILNFFFFVKMACRPLKRVCSLKVEHIPLCHVELRSKSCLNFRAKISIDLWCSILLQAPPKLGINYFCTNYVPSYYIFSKQE